MKDSRGNLWFGTEGGGAARYDGKTMMHFTTKEGLQDNNFLSIMEDRHGNIWIGTNTGGVNILSNMSFTYLSGDEGFVEKTDMSGISTKGSDVSHNLITILPDRRLPALRF